MTCNRTPAGGARRASDVECGAGVRPRPGCAAASGPPARATRPRGRRRSCRARSCSRETSSPVGRNGSATASPCSTRPPPRRRRRRRRRARCRPGRGRSRAGRAARGRGVVRGGREAEGEILGAGVDALRGPQQGGEERGGGHGNSVRLRRPPHIGRSPPVTPYAARARPYPRSGPGAGCCGAVCDHRGRGRRPDPRLPPRAFRAGRAGGPGSRRRRALPGLGLRPRRGAARARRAGRGRHARRLRRRGRRRRGSRSAIRPLRAPRASPRRRRALRARRSLAASTTSSRRRSAGRCPDCSSRPGSRPPTRSPRSRRRSRTRWPAGIALTRTQLHDAMRERVRRRSCPGARAARATTSPGTCGGAPRGRWAPRSTRTAATCCAVADRCAAGGRGGPPLPAFYGPGTAGRLRRVGGDDGAARAAAPGPRSPSELVEVRAGGATAWLLAARRGRARRPHPRRTGVRLLPPGDPYPAEAQPGAARARRRSCAATSSARSAARASCSATAGSPGSWKAKPRAATLELHVRKLGRLARADVEEEAARRGGPARRGPRDVAVAVGPTRGRAPRRLASRSLKTCICEHFGQCSASRTPGMPAASSSRPSPGAPAPWSGR